MKKKAVLLWFVYFSNLMIVPRFFLTQAEDGTLHVDKKVYILVQLITAMYAVWSYREVIQRGFENLVKRRFVRDIAIGYVVRVVLTLLLALVVPLQQTDNQANIESLLNSTSIVLMAYNQYDTKTFSLGFKRIQNLLGRMYPVDFSILPELKQPIIETINIALFSSILALCTTLILLPILTNVLFKLKIIPKIFSAIFSVFRTMPFLIIAAILVSLFSTGVFSGFVSIYLINILTSAKLLKEYAEEVEIKQLEAMESLGASKFIIYKNAILSNLKPQVISVYFLTLESSIRGASVLGLVGAGGIGQRLWQELNHLRYDRVSIIIITLVILIFVIDLVSYYFRNLQNTSQLTFEKFIFRKNLVKVAIPLVLIGSLIYVTNFIHITQERFFIGLKQLKVLAK